MILSDQTILEKIDNHEIKISSPEKNWRSQIHASSMDLRLGNFFKIYRHTKFGILDPVKMKSDDNLVQEIEIKSGKKFIIQPGEFVLGATMEIIELPDDLVARVEGRSSLGRLGIVIHSTAGFVDAGFVGTITLEITNINRMPVALYPGMRVCQLAFEQMTSKAKISYSEKKTSKYQNQNHPQESKIFCDPFFEQLRK